MENITTITLYDADNSKTYDIGLSTEDAQRASRDMTFAAALLKAAITDDNKNMAEEHNQQEDSLEAGETYSEKESDASVYRWTPASVMLLLHTYQEMKAKFSDGKNSHKKCWEVIAKKLNNEGHKVTGAQCSSKLHSLKKTYKAIKDHNSKTGNDRRTWQYLEVMDEIFGKNAWCEPVAVASSSGVSEKRVEATPGVQTSASNNNSGKQNILHLMKRRLEQKEVHENNKKKRHDEKMALDQKLLEVLQKIAEK